MKRISDRMIVFKNNLSTRMAPEYVLMLRADMNNFAREVEDIETENAKKKLLIKAMFDHMVQRAWDEEPPRPAGFASRVHLPGIEE